MILEGTGKGLLDSLIAEGGVKSRDLSRVIYMGVVIEIRRARSDRNAAKFYGYPFLFRRNFLRSLVVLGMAPCMHLIYIQCM